MFTSSRVHEFAMLKRGFTLVEVVVTIAVLAIVVAIALPNLLAMRMVANEGAVMEGMRAVVQACEHFRMQGTRGGVGEYPASLVAFTRSNPPYLDRRFNAVATGGTWNGYRWRYVPGNRTPQRVGNRLFTFRGTYTLTADPVWRGVTGRRSFFTDQSGVIRFNLRGGAGPTDPVVE